MSYFKVFTVLILLFVAGTGSSSLLSGFGELEASADIYRPASISEVYYNSGISYESEGEYVLLEVNKQVFDLSRWNLSSITDGDGENAINYSRKVRNDYVVLADDSDVVEDPGENWLVLDVGTFPISGLENSGEALRLGFIPENNLRIGFTNYTGSSCSEFQAYNVSKGECDDRELQVSGGSR